MMKFHSPPGRTSILRIVFVKPFGPHQWMTWRGSVHIRHTSSRGASNTRVAAISRSLVVAALAAAMLLLLFFQFAEVVVEAIEALLPKLFVAIDPVGRVLQRRRLA